MTEKGAAFTKEHPRSMFGDDNEKHFRMFKMLVKRAKQESYNDLYDFADDAYEDSSDHSFATGVLDWLFEDGDPPY